MLLLTGSNVGVNDDVIFKLGADGSPVWPAELRAPAGRDQRGEYVPAAPGAEDRRAPQRYAAPALLEGKVYKTYSALCV